LNATLILSELRCMVLGSTLLASITLLTACGGGGGGGGTAPATFSIGGTVSGLSGTGLVLQNNGGDNLPVGANGNFTFTTAVTDGSAYNVTVLTQPTGPLQTCTVGNGAGTAATTSVGNITVTCSSTPPITVTASVASANGGGGTVSCSANGAAAGACGSYAPGTQVTLTAQPDSVSNFTGWSGGGCSGTGACALTLTSDVAVTANFSRPTLTVSVVGNGSVSSSPAGISGCTGTCSTPFDRGTTVNLTASAGLSGWSGGGCAGNGACSTTLSADTTVTATFAAPGLPPFAQQAYAKASNAQAGDGALMNVALSGDTLVVGMSNESSNATGVNGNQADNSALNSGAVYVFTRIGSVWSQQAYLKASNTEGADQFGYSVAIDGDTLVVGTGSEDSNATGVNGNQADNSTSGSGAAYVFTRVGGTWTQQAYLKASNTGTDDDFGLSVAVSGDTIVVGARGEASSARGVNGNQADNSASLSGAAYVFTRANGVWTQQAYLKASNADAGDIFGESVAIAGDTIAVAARFESSSATGVNGNQADNGANRSGAVYVFVRSGGAWTQQAYLKASNTDAGDEFGYGLALSADTLAVAARLESSNARGVNGNQADNSAAGSGAVYVFARSNGVWSQQAYLKASNSDAGDTFGNEGHGVALWGDTLVVGAMREDSGAAGVNGNQADNSSNGSGAAYVFKRTAGVWSQSAYLKASNTGVVDGFGWAVAVSGDTVVVAAPGEASNATGVNGNQADNSAFSSGAAYVFVAQ
jgi:FG-GAP repeat/Divergent InlB B-repeat domain